MARAAAPAPERTPPPVARQLLRRPGPAPGRDDRLLRAAVVRAAAVPDAVSAAVHRPADGVELPDPATLAGLPRPVRRRHRAGRERPPRSGHDARPDRPRAAAVVGARAAVG